MNIRMIYDHNLKDHHLAPAVLDQRIANTPRLLWLCSGALIRLDNNHDNCDYNFGIWVILAKKYTHYTY